MPVPLVSTQPVSRTDVIRFYVASLTLLASLCIVCPGYLLLFDTTPKICILLGGVAFMSASLAVATPARLMRPSRTGTLVISLLLVRLVVVCFSYVRSPSSCAAVTGTSTGLGLLPEIALVLWGVGLFHGLSTIDFAPVLLVKIIVIYTALIAVYALIQTMGFDPLIEKSLYVEYGVTRAPSTLGHAGALAGISASSTFICLALVRSTTRLPWRLVGYSGAALAVMAVFVSGTRSGIVGLWVGLLVTFVFGIRRFQVVVVIPVLCASVLAAWIFMSPTSELSLRFNQFLSDTSGGGRPTVWKDSLSMISHRPLFGYGPEAFPCMFPRFVGTQLAQQYPDIYRESGHNIIIDELVSTGILGLSAAVAAAVAIVRVLWKLRSTRRNWASLLCAALASHLVVSMFFTMTISTTMHMYAVALLAIAPSGPTGTCVYTRRVTILTMRLFFIAVTIVSTAFAYNLWTGDRKNILIAQELAANAYDQAITTAALASPRMGMQYLWISEEFQRAAALTQSTEVRVSNAEAGLAAARLAVQTAPDRHNAYLNLAIAYASLNRPPDVERALMSAIECAPNWYRPHWLLAELLISQQRSPAARRHAEIALRLGGQADPATRKSLELITSGRESPSLP